MRETLSEFEDVWLSLGDRERLVRTLRRLARQLPGAGWSSDARPQNSEIAALVQAAAERTEDAITLIGSIRASSELAALAQRWTLQLIGQALADPGGPSWAEIGQALSKLDRNGDVALARLSRQAARQRYAQYAVVEYHRLLGRVARLERQVTSLESRLKRITFEETLIGTPHARNRAELRRDARLTRAELIETTTRLDLARDELAAMGNSAQRA